MLKNTKTATLLAIAALTAGGKHEASAMRMKSGSEWHLAMVPDAFEHNNFISAPGRSLGFGFSDPFGPSNFGGFGSAFDDFGDMPSFGRGFGDMMRRAEEAGDSSHGQSYSTSSSSSYSSSMGADGKKHEKSSKQGQQKVCKDGQCKVVTCKNGKCEEMVVSGEQMKNSESKAQFDSKMGGHQPSLADVESEMQDSFANMGRSMNQRMQKMEDGFRNMERNMAQSFNDLPNKMHELAANGGDGQTQMYSSSMQQSTDDEGKVHTKTSKTGSKTSCVNGQCKQTICKNGKCQEKVYQERPDKSGDGGVVLEKVPQHKKSKQATEGDGDEPQGGMTKDEFKKIFEKMKQAHGDDQGGQAGQGGQGGQGGQPQGITKEEFQKILEKIKQHVKAKGGNPDDVVVKVVPMGEGEGDIMKKMQPKDDVPPPPPAFAPKDK